jgi:hypothetical protein
MGVGLKNKKKWSLETTTINREFQKIHKSRENNKN